MALTDFLYRCPACGAEPLEGRGRAASCGGCGRTFVPTANRRALRVEGAAGHEGEMTMPEARAAIDARGGALSRAEGSELRRTARVRLRLAEREEPVYYGGRLLGWFEKFGTGREGRLALDDTTVSFTPDDPKGPSHAWTLLDVRALQSSSSTVQISLPGDRISLFRFPADSSRRWEELFQEALRRAWLAAGRGEIVEFQPRIRAR